MKELIEKYMDKKGYITFGKMKVAIKITDIKRSYGNVRFFVEPVSGTGKMWVEQVELSAN